MCEYCKYRFSWDCEEGYVSYPGCESFTLDWGSLSGGERDLIEAILKGILKGVGESRYDF